ncbi:MAG: tetraacyldisaccharide 4'-kinase [Terracidiphilus sp.]
MKRPWLAPLVPLYAAGAAWRAFTLRHAWQGIDRLRWPVISIGNLSSGGSGKTPLTIALARLLAARGVSIDVLSRGYGRLGSHPMRVDPAGTAEQFGDEPLLIAREAGVPVYVAPQRCLAGILAETDARKDVLAQQLSAGSASSHAHILDDGFQHRRLHRDFDILLLDSIDFHDTLLPAGNLREPLRAALRATVLAVPAGDIAFEAELRAFGWQGPLWRVRRHMELPVFRGPALAFCGIARPAQFFSGLKAAGVRVSQTIAFPDHHRYTAKDVKHLEAAAKHSGSLAFLTTEKDKVRIEALDLGRPLLTAGLRTEIEDEQAAFDWLVNRIAAPQPR